MDGQARLAGSLLGRRTRRRRRRSHAPHGTLVPRPRPRVYPAPKQGTVLTLP
jgi:hypothetical protein